MFCIPLRFGSMWIPQLLLTTIHAWRLLNVILSKRKKQSNQLKTLKPDYLNETLNRKLIPNKLNVILITWYGNGWLGTQLNCDGGPNCCGGICQLALVRPLFKSCTDELNARDRESDSVPSSCVVISSKSLTFRLIWAFPFLKWRGKLEKLPDLSRGPNELDPFDEFRLSLLIRYKIKSVNA